MKILTPGIVALLAIGFLCSCGVDFNDLYAITISPADAQATHGSANDKVLFKAIGNFAPTGSTIVRSEAINDAQWATSDTSNVSIDSQGWATCTGHTPTAALILASHKGASGITVTGTATLMCF